jgi:acyl-coenzyme A synthetase/AMP-(fatty) acid ligase
MESAVVAVKDRNGKERPLGFVQLTKDFDLTPLYDLCTEKLGAKARPISLVSVAEIPRTGSGKVDRLKAAKDYSHFMKVS